MCVVYVNIVGSLMKCAQDVQAVNVVMDCKPD